MEEKDWAELEPLRQKVEPLARQFLENPELFEKLKAASPWLSEEYLVEMLRDTMKE